MVHRQKNPPNLGRIGCVSQVANPKRLQLLFHFNEKGLFGDFMNLSSVSFGIFFILMHL